MIIVKKECICNDEEVILMALFGRFGHRGPYRKGEIKIRYTKFLMVMEIIGIVMLVGLLIYTAFRYPMVPDEIPTHYGSTGEADAWGSKTRLWTIPAVSFLVYGLVTLASFFPNAWNYPAKIPVEKLPRAENKVRQMLACMKVLITGLFIYLQFEMLSLSESVSMGVTFVFMLLMFAIMIYFIAALRRLSNERVGLLQK